MNVEEVSAVVVDASFHQQSLCPVHTKQLLTYLRLLHLPIGLLINFSAATFKEGVKRIVNNHKDFASSRLRVNQDLTRGHEGREKS